MDWLPYQDVYANLLASGLAGGIGRVVATHRPGTDAYLAPPSAAHFEAGVRERAALSGGDEVKSEYPEREFRAFLLSAEAAEMVELLLVAQLLKSDELRTLVRDRFAMTMAWYVGRPDRDVDADAGRLFERLVADCEREVNVMYGRSVPPSLEEAAEDASFLPDGIEASERLGQLFGRQAVPDFEEVGRFTESLRTTTASRLRNIVLPNSDGDITRDRLYTPPTFSEFGRDGRPNSTARIPYDLLKHTIHRTVVLGNPGAGKSTFSETLCFEMATAPVRDARVAPVPLLVVMRDYAVYKREEGGGITGFLPRTLQSDHSLSLSEDGLAYLLLSGRTLVVFDGLDELINLEDRKRVRSDVAAFSDLFPFVRVLATSREEGYSAAPLPADRFDAVRINDFDDNQVEAYVSSWFGLNTKRKKSERAELARGFLNESMSVPDLRVNPLLLALMCTLYQRLGYIPRRRSEVYRQCAEMLFERWDKGRGIDSGLRHEDHLLPLLQRLASWVFFEQERQSGVTRTELLSEVERYFREDVVGEGPAARRAAEQFVSFCHGRGWVLREVGATEDEPLYGFAHRTFLEYFTAAWLAAQDASAEQLIAVLAPHLRVGQWETLGLLAVQIRAETRHGSGNQMFAALLDAAAACEPEQFLQRQTLLGFAGSVTTFLTPRPTLTTRFAALSCDAFLHGGRYARAATDEELKGDICLATVRLRSFLWVGLDDEVELFDKPARDHLTTALQGDDEVAAGAAIQLLTLLKGVAGFDGQPPVHPRSWPLDPSLNELTEQWIDRSELVASWLHANRYPTATTGRLCAAHGPAWLWEVRASPSFPLEWYPSVAELVAHTAVGGTGRAAIYTEKWAMEEAASAAEVLVQHEPPWARPGAFAGFDNLHQPFPQIGDNTEPSATHRWSDQALLGLVLLTAALFEKMNSALQKRRTLDTFDQSDGDAGPLLAEVCRSDWDDADELGFEGEERAFLNSLMRRSQRLVSQT